MFQVHMTAAWKYVGEIEHVFMTIKEQTNYTSGTFPVQTPTMVLKYTVYNVAL